MPEETLALTVLIPCRNEEGAVGQCVRDAREFMNRLGIRGEVLESIMHAVQEKLEHRVKGTFRIGAVMFSNVYGELGATEEAKAILRSWETAAIDNKEDRK